MMILTSNPNKKGNKNNKIIAALIVGIIAVSILIAVMIGNFVGKDTEEPTTDITTEQAETVGDIVIDDDITEENDNSESTTEKNETVIKFEEPTVEKVTTTQKPTQHTSTVKPAEPVTVAYNGSAGSSGKLYSGQHIKIAYKYTADNTWSAIEYLRGSMYHYNGSKWANVYSSNGGYDAAKNKVGISKSLPVTLNSSIGIYTVPVTTQNKLRFKLDTWWFSDKTNTLEETWYDLPVVKSDVALTKITLVDSSTKSTLDTNNLKAGQSVLVRYTYKNNTDVKVYVEGFKNDKTQISGVYAIPANSSITVDGYTFIVPNKRNISIWGGVYLEGMGIYNTDYESNGNNNALTLACKVKHPLTLEPITHFDR